MKGSRKPNILITNDDGVTSHNLLALAGALCEAGNVFVVAPDSEKSGVSHAFTHRHGLVTSTVEGNFPFSFHSLSGTPSDCVKFAVSELHKDIRFDLVFSGLNVGENAGVSAIYSGTVAGAREGALWRIPSVAISLYADDDYARSIAVAWAREMVLRELFREMSAGSFWNVNFPQVLEGEYKGLRVTPMNLGMFTDHYCWESGTWMLEGAKVAEDILPHSDDWYLARGYASLTPMALDQTAATEISKLQALSLNASGF